MANHPPRTGPSNDVTALISLPQHTIASSEPSVFADRFPVSERPMLQTPTLPSLHHGFPALPRSGLAATHLHLPPLDTRLSRPAGPSIEDPIDAAANLPSKRRRIEGSEASQAQPTFQPFADSSGPRRGPDVGDFPFLSSGPRTIHSDYHALRRADDIHALAKSSSRVTGDDQTCCQIGCGGPHCTNARKLVAELIAEITERDISLPDAGAGAGDSVDYNSNSPAPHLHKISLLEALEWALGRLRWNNSALRQLIISQSASQPAASAPGSAAGDQLSLPASNAAMKRQHDPTNSEHEVQPRPTYPTQGSSRQPWASNLEHWTSQETQSSHAQGQRKFSFSSTPSLPALQSPPHNPHAAAARMLPSPSSLTLPIPTASGSPALSAFTSAAQTAHMQDLQHQVSVKSLTLSTLQREYEALLQKLERMRVKSAALEKKFEVSDAELNGLLDEKDRLEKQVEMLEKQLEEATTARDEARKQSSEQAAQYMRILDMGNQLQRKAAEDRKVWEKEKESLVDRIKELELSERSARSSARPFQSAASTPERETLPATPSGSVTPSAKQITRRVETTTSKSTEVNTQHQSTPSSTSITSEAVQQELQRLRARIQVLEAALAKSKREGEIIKEAALRLASIDGSTDEG